MPELYRILQESDCLYYPDIPLAPFTAFAVGGNADCLILPRQRRELLNILGQCQVADLTLLGGGANVLVADSGIRGPVLSLRQLQGLEWQGRQVIAEAGWDVSALCRIFAAQGAAGLHHFYGMPGSLGGAVYMNARCYEGQISNIVRRVLCVPRGVSRGYGPMHWVSLGALDWSYKYSHFQHDSGHELAGAIIVAVELELREQSRSSLEREMQSFLEDRISKGHFRRPCAGSFFKNNRAFGAPSGQIIDGIGLKGLRHNGAQLAPWHGNIIINAGRARARDIWDLACTVRKEVLRRTGFELEPEVQRLGDWGQELPTPWAGS